MTERPHYLRIARALAFVSVVGANASCARVVTPDWASDAHGDALTADRADALADATTPGDAACPTSMPAAGTACTPPCRWGQKNSCDFCECVEDPNGAPSTWHCYLCGGPCVPPDLGSSGASAIG